VTDFIGTIVVLVLIGGLLSVRQWPEWFRRARSANWPTVLGIVETGEVSTIRGRRNAFGPGTEEATAKVGYSYTLDGEYYSGYHTRAFNDEQKAWSYVDALKGTCRASELQPTETGNFRFTTTATTLASSLVANRELVSRVGGEQLSHFP
jgi:hypothetical protein